MIARDRADAGSALLRPAWAEVDLRAVRHNAGVLAAAAAPARLCAVVKAGGYGHGAVEVAGAALEGGAACLAVALVEEGRTLRRAGITAPVLLLSEPTRAAMDEVVALGLTPTLYTRAGVESVVSAVRRRGADRGGGPAEPFAVHVKVDTGMHRVGAHPDEGVEVAQAVSGQPELDLQGLWTHLAVSEELDDPYTDRQLGLFDDTLRRLAEVGVRPTLRHAANSAAAMWVPRSHYDMVRCGIALYGLSPSSDGVRRGPAGMLRPAMTLKARVTYVKEVAAGERLSYGLRYRVDVDSVIATVPLGYADGVTRSLSATGGVALIGGRRCPISGTVTMDQILVDCGPGADVRRGDEVVLLGVQGNEEITAWEWAERTGTIAYEVVCGVSGRVPRTYLDG